MDRETHGQPDDTSNGKDKTMTQRNKVFKKHNLRCIVIQPSRELAAIISHAAKSAGLVITEICLTANDALNAIQNLLPDVVLMHGMFPGLNYDAVLATLDKVIIPKYPALIFNMPAVVIAACGITERCFTAPYDPKALIELVASALPLPARQDIIERAKILLRRLGIPERPALSYLAHASALLFNNTLDSRCLSKYIYPTVAKAHNTNGKAVAEAIRRAIETAWTKGDIEKQYLYFKNSISAERGKPTNAELIALTAQIIKCGEDW